MNNVEKKEIMDDLNVALFNEFVKSQYGIDVNLSREVYEMRGTLFIQLTSEDIAGKLKDSFLQSSFFKTLSIKITGEFVDDNTIGFSAEYAYTHPMGGSNGLRIGFFWYKNGEFLTK